MNQGRIFKVLLGPHFTEKATSAVGSANQVVFKVALTANKLEIKKAVEQLFNVKVERVTSATQKGKLKRNKFGIYKRSDFKKAFVLLKDGSEIQFEGIN